MLYTDIKLIIPQEIYSQYLKSINSVKLTKREIDIIACIMNGRSAKGIARLLSISPKTVESHIYNTMNKLGCSSRESLLTLIERSDRFTILKEYYLKMLIYREWEYTLKEISILITNLTPKNTRLIVYYKEQDHYILFFHYLKNHLFLAGVSAFFEARGTLQVSLNKSNDELQTKSPQLVKIFKISKKTHLYSTNIIFLEVGKSTASLKDRIQACPYLSLEDQKGYYFLVSDILQKILPQLELENILSTFKEKLSHISTPYSSLTQNISFEEVSNEKKYSRKPSIKGFLKNNKLYIIFNIIIQIFLTIIIQFLSWIGVLALIKDIVTG